MIVSCRRKSKYWNLYRTRYNKVHRLFFSNPIVNNSSNTVIVHSVIESTKGTFFSDGENFYETKDVEVIKEFGKYDLMGNFVPMPKNQDFNIITIGRLSRETTRQIDLCFSKF